MTLMDWRSNMTSEQTNTTAKSIKDHNMYDNVLANKAYYYTKNCSFYFEYFIQFPIKMSVFKVWFEFNFFFMRCEQKEL